MSTPHRWTMGLFSDASGVWLMEWRGEYEFREWIPTRSSPGPWSPDESCPQFRGIANNANREIPRALAREILSSWRYCRNHKIATGWMEL